jgi:GAF domain-containing protein
LLKPINDESDIMTSDTEFFQTFCSLSEAFSTAASVEELLQLIVASAVDTMDAKAACLFLEDKKADYFVPKAQAGLSKTYIHANPIRAHKLVKALAKDGYLIFEDAITDERLENHEAKKAEGIASILTVGVVVDERLIGILSLYTGKKQTFTQNQVIFLKALAANGGVALKKARLLERIEQNTSLFLELSSAINSTLEIKSILNSLTEKTATALGMKGATIRLFDEDSKELSLVASHGLSDEFNDKSQVVAGSTLDAALQGKTVLLEDLTTDATLQYPEKMVAEGIVSMVTVPIESRDKVIGVMRLYGDSPRQFSEQFVRVVRAVAHSGALAIQNASMYLALKEDKKSLEEDIWSHRLYF